MSGSELITCLSPLHYSLIRRLLFNNMGLLWPPMLSVKWSFRPFSASGRISVAVSEQSACSAASCSPREMCSMPPFHSVSFYPVSQNSWFSEGGKKNCIAHHFWCIVLAFFKAPSFRYAKSHLSLLMHSITLQQQYAFAASAAAAHWNILGSILHMPKLVSFHLLRNWCIIGSAAVLLLYASRLYPLWIRQFPYSISAILRSAALYMLFTWVPTWKKLSFYLSNICPTKSLLSLFVALPLPPILYAYFLQGIFFCIKGLFQPPKRPFSFV